MWLILASQCCERKINFPDGTRHWANGAERRERTIREADGRCPATRPGVGLRNNPGEMRLITYRPAAVPAQLAADIPPQSPPTLLRRFEPPETARVTRLSLAPCKQVILPYPSEFGQLAVPALERLRRACAPQPGRLRANVAFVRSFRFRTGTPVHRDLPQTAAHATALWRSFFVRPLPRLCRTRSPSKSTSD